MHSVVVQQFTKLGDELGLYVEPCVVLFVVMMGVTPTNVNHPQT